ncbi:MAG: GntR family transcriptional regulator [bacterium]|nr:GntR family transcriptional regulator [bacterium]
MFRLTIDSSSSVPIYKQAALAIKVEILAGRLKDGDILPPIRELAKIIKMHPNTVAKVYTSLEDEGFIKGKMGSGHWVTFKDRKLDSLKKALIEDEFRNFIERVLAIGASKEEIKKLVLKYLDGESHD